MRFNEVLNELRNEIYINQKNLANRLNIDPATYRNYESGNLEPDFETLINISRFFDVSTDYLLGESKIKNCNSYQQSLLIDETTLSEDENQLLISYRKLTVIMKAEIRGEIKGILEACKEDSPATNEVQNDVVKRAMYFLLIIGLKVNNRRNSS